MRSLSWKDLPENLVLRDNQVHLWRANLKLSPEKIEELEATLSDDEISRANRFHFPQHRKRFVATRGILRQLLSWYLKSDLEDSNNNLAKNIVLEYGDRGKPSLKSFSGKYNLEFNISHSEDLALYGFTRDRKIGVDLEYINSRVDCYSIAKRFFCPQELKLLDLCKPERRKKLFFKLWTAKEAYLKATGEGLAGGLDNIQIDFNPQGIMFLKNINDRSIPASYWWIYNFLPGSNFVATMAVLNNKKKLSIESFNWN